MVDFSVAGGRQPLKMIQQKSAEVGPESSMPEL